MGPSANDGGCSLCRGSPDSRRDDGTPIRLFPSEKWKMREPDGHSFRSVVLSIEYTGELVWHMCL